MINAVFFIDEETGWIVSSDNWGENIQMGCLKSFFRRKEYSLEPTGLPVGAIKRRC
jgi:hypothetical protein